MCFTLVLTGCGGTAGAPPYRVRPDGSDLELLTDFEGSEREPSFSPDHHRAHLAAGRQRALRRDPQQRRQPQPELAAARLDLEPSVKIRPSVAR